MIIPPVHAHWYPHHTTSQYTPPEPGQLIAYAHVVWRVIEVHRVPEDQWTDEERQAYRLRSSPEMAWHAGAVPVVVVVRPAVIASDDPSARKHDKHLRPRRAMVDWRVYRDEHYPICAKCGEPTPCREVLNQRTAEQAMAQMARYEQPGVCPSCEQPVTARQKSWTWHENLEIPGGPPVTYHVGRRGCRWSAAEYDRRWVALNPEQRTARWYCAGHALTHNDGTYQCTAGDSCPGPLAEHESFTACSCGRCRERGELVDARPSATARRT